MSIQTKSIGSGQSVQVQPESTTKLQAAKKPAEAKDTMKSQAPDAQATEAPKKSFGERIKDCFNAILAWIKDNLLCCFFGKKSQGSESSSTSTASISSASASKPKVETEDQKKANAAVAEFRKELQKVVNRIISDMNLAPEFITETKLLDQMVKDKAGDEAIRAQLAKLNTNTFGDPSPLQEKFEAKDQKGFLEMLADVMGFLRFFTNQSTFEPLVFVEFVLEKNPSKVEIESVFYSLSKQTQENLVTTFNEANQQNLSEKEFLAVCVKRENLVALKKWDASVAASFKAILDESNSG